jgi:hypothetical protein
LFLQHHAYDSEAEASLAARVVSWGGPPCLDYIIMNDYWSFRWCNEDSVTQIKYNKKSQSVEDSHPVDVYLPRETVQDDHRIEQWYQSPEADCVPSTQPGADSHGPRQRSAVVLLYCCGNQLDNPGRQHLIANVLEPQACHYRVQVCAADLCGVLTPTHVSINDHNLGGFGGSKGERGEKETKKMLSKSKNAAADSGPPGDARDPRGASFRKKVLPMFSARPAGVGPAEQADLRERAREMFVHAYDGYMQYGFPNVSVLLGPYLCSCSCLYFG